MYQSFIKINSLFSVSISQTSNDESGVKIGHDELNDLTFEQRELMGISSFLDPRCKTFCFLEGYERELVNLAAIKQRRCL